MPSTRRQLIAAGGGAAALAACGDRRGPGSTPEARRLSDWATLSELIGIERATAAAYREGLRLLEGPARRLARTALEHELEHVRALEREIVRLGFDPAPRRTRAEHRRSFPLLRSGADALRFAVDLEQRLVRLYMDFIPRFYATRLRRLSAEIVAVEAEHLSLLLREQGRDPLPQAFVTGTA